MTAGGHRAAVVRALALAFACAAAAGCASLAGRTQRVALDDTPRGGTVRDPETPEAAPLAATPAVVERVRAPSQTLVFAPPSGPPVTVHLDCDFRWRVVGLGNAPILLASLSLYGLPWAAAVGTDLLTGAAWDCPLVIRPPAAPPLAADDPTPRHYLVLEAEHDDTAVQDALARAWRDAMAPHLRPGDDVILPESHRALLTRLGDPRHTGELTRRRLNTLVMATGATHLVTLKWTPGTGGTTLDAELYDAYRETTTAAPTVVAPPVDTGDGHFRWQTLFEYLHFIPNSVAWLPAVTQFEPVAKVDDRKIEATPRASLPTWISGWTLTSASHPDAFDAWDLHGKIEPTIGLNLIDVDVTAQGGEAGSGAALPATDERFEAWVLRVYYELGGTAHTPLGAFDLAFLAGYAGAWQARWAEQASRLRGRVELGLGFTYTAFLSERVYFRAGIQQFTPLRPLLETDDFEAKNLTQGWLGLGVYMPETRWWLRSLFL